MIPILTRTALLRFPGIGWWGTPSPSRNCAGTLARHTTMIEQRRKRSEMGHAPQDLLAIPDKRARELAGISMRQLRYWEEVGLILPSIRRQVSQRKIVRLYTYPDMMELLIAAAIRNLPNMSLQHLRRVVNSLRQRGYQAPLRELDMPSSAERFISNTPVESGKVSSTRIRSSWTALSTSNQSARRYLATSSETRTRLVRSCVVAVSAGASRSSRELASPWPRSSGTSSAATKPRRSSRNILRSPTPTSKQHVITLLPTAASLMRFFLDNDIPVSVARMLSLNPPHDFRRSGRCRCHGL